MSKLQDAFAGINASIVSNGEGGINARTLNSVLTGVATKALSDAPANTVRGSLLGGDLVDIPISSLPSSGGGSGPASTDALPEGTTNLYFTPSRARGVLSVQPGCLLSYNATSGLLSFTATLATVATSGAYADLTGKPTLSSGAYADLTGKPALSTVATSGSYADLLNKPAFATVATSGLYSDLTGRPTLAAIATSGSAADLLAAVFPIARHPTVTATPGTYGSGSQIPVITTDGYGHITGITTVANTGGGGGGGTGSINPTGSFAANDVILAATTDGTSIKSGGPASTLVRGLLSGVAGIAFNSSTGAFSLAAPTTSVLGGVLSSTRPAN